MQMDWRRIQQRHPWLIKAFVILKRYRTKVGFALAAYCLVEGLWDHEVPVRLDRPNIIVVVSLVLILIGMILRIWSNGCIRKKETLATSGAYSLCRHPLYLGSMCITYGFCFLLDDAVNFVVATLYFAVFYTVTIIWEEVRLAERYGASHQAYCQATPLLVPHGKLRAGPWSWRRAWAAGGLRLAVVTTGLLFSVQLMAIFMVAHHHAPTAAVH